MLQAVLFDRNGKNKWTIAEAKHWLIDHKFKPLKVHMTKEKIRFRITEPNYSRYRVKHLSNGIEMIIGY